MRDLSKSIQQEGATIAPQPTAHENTCELTDSQIKLAQQEAERQRVINKLTQGCKIDLSATEIEPQPLYSLDGIPVFSRGNISVISGKPKSGKTFLMSLLCKEILKSNDEIKILIVDTEQGIVHVKKCVKRVHRLMEWDEDVSNHVLDVYALRKLSTVQRLVVVEELISDLAPDFVFIDGIKDLISSINNETDSSDLCDRLMKWSYDTDCHICSVLHENKTDTSLRGHLGTELQNKSETVISVSKSDDIVKITPKFTRNEEFDGFSFKINADGLPERFVSKTGSKPADKLKLLLETILTANSAGLRYTDLCKQIVTIGKVKEKTAQGKIKKATDDGIIYKCELSGHYFLSSPIDNDDENEDNDTINEE
ncbi:MAG: AAA family ATPase [Dysgonamonadaceae bacterium]|jgi:broad-specificity NMP kinase|nr:AAA family ATPase [Dysgonamonadaceae bacterium]